MKLSLNWLKDYIKFDLSPEKLANRLTMAGLEVEKIETLNGDTIFELEITPNRPDCLNILGLARETSAILNIPLKKPSSYKYSAVKIKTSIQIDNKEDCRRYIGTVIENVRVSLASPKIKERITALGIRSINNVVDITNFCLMEIGQPLHAFDYDKLVGGKIVVRRAKEGEKIITIDGVKRKLDPSILVIADERKPVAIAGIMGGKDTEVTDKTKNILLESAYFDPVLIRRAGRKLGLSSDSSYRFERGVDFDGVKRTSDRAIQLILESAGGKITKQTDLNLYKTKTKKTVIQIKLEQINSCLGADLKASYCKNILEKLECKVSVTKNNFKIVSPSHRGDLKTSVDIIEEIGRIIGYDQLPSSLPKITISSLSSNRQRSHRNKIRETLLSQGLDETVGYAMIDQKSLKKTGLDALAATKIKNPLSQEQEMMRPSNLPTLLNIVATNFNKGEKNLKLFELGKIYSSGNETECLGVIMTGRQNNDWRETTKKECDYYDVKGTIEQVFDKLGVNEINFYPQQQSYFDDSLGVNCVVSNKTVGCLGRISDEVLTAWDIKIKNLYYANIDLEALYGLVKKDAVKFKTIASFPAVVRDVSLAVKQETSFDQIKTIIKKMGGGLLADIRFIEQYQGEKIQSGLRGIVFSLTYQSFERTLREDEVNALHEKIVQTVVEQFGALRR